jgi:hypothetical protein
VGEGDKAGLAAIKALHHQLDDDHDGTIEPQETGDFIKADLKHDGTPRLRWPTSGAPGSALRSIIGLWNRQLIG